MAEADGIENSAMHHAAEADMSPDTVASETSVSVGPQTVGQRLHAAREAAGLEIAAVAATTRIAVRHLAALERGDYASMQGRPYVLGFARNYARALGLDPHDIVAAVRGELDSQAPAPAPRVIHQFEVGDPAKTPSRLIGWLVLMLLVGVIAMGLVFWRSYYLPAAGLPSLIGPEEPAPPPAAAALPPVVQAPTPSGPVVFTALEDGVWVKFYDGAGVQLMQKQMAKDESFTVPAQATDPRLWTGRPDALRITIGGQEVPRIADKEGIVKNIAVSAQALLARGSQPAAAAPVSTQAAAVAPQPAAANHVRSKSRVRPPATVSTPASPSEPAATPAPAASSTAIM